MSTRHEDGNISCEEDSEIIKDGGICTTDSDITSQGCCGIYDEMCLSDNVNFLDCLSTILDSSACRPMPEFSMLVENSSNSTLSNSELNYHKTHQNIKSSGDESTNRDISNYFKEVLINPSSEVQSNIQHPGLMPDGDSGLPMTNNEELRAFMKNNCDMRCSSEKTSIWSNSSDIVKLNPTQMITTAIIKTGLDEIAWNPLDVVLEELTRTGSISQYKVQFCARKIISRVLGEDLITHVLLQYHNDPSKAEIMLVESLVACYGLQMKDEKDRKEMESQQTYNKKRVMARNQINNKKFCNKDEKQLPSYRKLTESFRHKLTGKKTSLVPRCYQSHYLYHKYYLKDPHLQRKVGNYKRPQQAKGSTDIESHGSKNTARGKNHLNCYNSKKNNLNKTPSEDIDLAYLSAKRCGAQRNRSPGSWDEVETKTVIQDLEGDIKCSGNRPDSKKSVTSSTKSGLINSSETLQENSNPDSILKADTEIKKSKITPKEVSAANAKLEGTYRSSNFSKFNSKSVPSSGENNRNISSKESNGTRDQHFRSSGNVKQITNVEKRGTFPYKNPTTPRTMYENRVRFRTYPNSNQFETSNRKIQSNINEGAPLNSKKLELNHKIRPSANHNSNLSQSLIRTDEATNNKKISKWFNSLNITITLLSLTAFVILGASIYSLYYPWVTNTSPPSDESKKEFIKTFCGWSL